MISLARWVGWLVVGRFLEFVGRLGFKGFSKCLVRVSFSSGLSSSCMLESDIAYSVGCFFDFVGRLGLKGLQSVWLS